MDERLINVLICHVCGGEKKPYTVLMNNDIFGFLRYERAREKGEICERCNNYYMMTGEFRDASDREHEIAKDAFIFATNMLKWWHKDKSLDEPLDKYVTGYEEDYQSRNWEGTEMIAEWYRKEKQKGKTLSKNKVYRLGHGI